MTLNQEDREQVHVVNFNVGLAVAHHKKNTQDKWRLRRVEKQPGEKAQSEATFSFP